MLGQAGRYAGAGGGMKGAWLQGGGRSGCWWMLGSSWAGWQEGVLQGGGARAEGPGAEGRGAGERGGARVWRAGAG